MRIAVGIPTYRRPEVLRATLHYLSLQTRLADRVIVCATNANDLDPSGYADTGCPIDIIYGPQGSCSQRNSIIEAASGIDVLVFFDDDFIMEKGFIAETELLFGGFDGVVMATGLVLADGATNGGLSVDAVAGLFEKARTQVIPPMQPVQNGYGCNMAVRLATIMAQNIRFDEALPLYGWLEDVDFSTRLARFGKIVKSSRLQGVHLGTKQGRTSGIRFGYSQIANPIYMVGKRSVSVKWAAMQIVRNVAMNIRKFRQPEPWVDRHGRLKGNVTALIDLVRGRLSPDRILEIQ